MFICRGGAKSWPGVATATTDRALMAKSVKTLLALPHFLFTFHLSKWKDHYIWALRMCYSNPWCRRNPWDTRVLAIVQAWWFQWKWSSSDADGRMETTVCKTTASLFCQVHCFCIFDFFLMFFPQLMIFHFYFIFHSVSFIHIHIFSFSLSFTISCLLVITWFLVSCHNALIEIYSSLTLLIRFIYNLFTFDLCVFNLIVLFLLLYYVFYSSPACFVYFVSLHC